MLGSLGLAQVVGEVSENGVVGAIETLGLRPLSTYPHYSALSRHRTNVEANVKPLVRNSVVFRGSAAQRSRAAECYTVYR